MTLPPPPRSAADTFPPAPDSPPVEAPFAPGGGATLTRMRTAAAEARRLRAETLAGLAVGRLNSEEVLDRAAERTDHPLRRLKLMDVLSAPNGVGLVTATRLLDRVRRVLGEPDLPFKAMTISWLLDRRSGGRRYLAWLEATTRGAAPWPGWPYTPSPVDGPPGAA